MSRPWFVTFVAGHRHVKSRRVPIRRVERGPMLLRSRAPAPGGTRHRCDFALVFAVVQTLVALACGRSLRRAYPAVRASRSWWRMSAHGSSQDGFLIAALMNAALSTRLLSKPSMLMMTSICCRDVRESSFWNATR